MFKPKGFSCGSGFVGFLPNDTRMTFPTEQEYLEYVEVFLERDNAA